MKQDLLGGLNPDSVVADRQTKKVLDAFYDPRQPEEGTSWYLLLEIKTHSCHTECLNSLSFSFNNYNTT